MSYLQLTGGAYTSRSLIAATQRCLNLYVESVPQSEGEPSGFVHLPTPGLTVQAYAPQEVCRCMYTASTGDLYAVFGNGLYYINSSFALTLIGTMVGSNVNDIVTQRTPVYICDNGVTALMVDGSLDGWTWNVTTRSGFARIDYTADPNTGFYGSTRAEYLDTFFLLNKIGSQIFYTSATEAATFDPLDFASKVGASDHLVAAVPVHRVLWLIGQYSCEQWINTGGDGTITGSFPFSIAPSAFLDRGCAAPYSIATTNNNVFFLSQDKRGHCIILRGEGYNSTRVSTYAIEDEISAYSKITQAVGYCMQMDGHDWYILNFGTADKTWVYDATMKEWHERCTLDANGNEHRHRVQCAAFAYGQVVGGDWEDTRIYTYDLNNLTDDGTPIKRLRHFPHILDPEGNRRIFYKQLVANMQVGTATSDGPVRTIADATFTAADGTLLQSYVPPINDRGATFTKLSGTANEQIISDTAVLADVGNALYQISGTPTTADYEITFSVTPDNYIGIPNTGSMTYVIGRANASHNGYRAALLSNGSEYEIQLKVMGTATTETVGIGLLSAGSYDVTFRMQSTGIAVQVYRTSDGMWAYPDSTWSGLQDDVIAISDSTYTAAGVVLQGAIYT